MKSARKFWYTGSIVVAMLIAGGLGFVFLLHQKIHLLRYNLLLHTRILQ